MSVSRKTLRSTFMYTSMKAGIAWIEASGAPNAEMARQTAIPPMRVMPTTAMIATWSHCRR